MPRIYASDALHDFANATNAGTASANHPLILTHFQNWAAITNFDPKMATLPTLDPR